MNRRDLPYVLVTILGAVTLFGAGRWSATPDRPNVVRPQTPCPQLQVPIQTERPKTLQELGIPTPPEPTITVEPAPAPVVSQKPSRQARRSAAQPVAPTLIVLEESDLLPSNPYRP